METIKAWNKLHPKGTPVEVLPHHRTNGKQTATVTKYPAFRNKKGYAMVKLVGFSFPVSLQFVKAI